MKKAKILCLTTITIAMLALTACAGKPDETPENSPTLVLNQDGTEDKPAALTPEPTKRPEDKKTVAQHKKIAEKIYQAVKASCVYRAEMMVQDDKEYMKEVLGLDSSWYDVAIVEIPMMSTNVDMFALIHPTKGNLENVETALKNYQDFLINDSFQYPMNLEKVKNCKAVTIGDYVFFILLSSPDNAIKAIEEVLAEEK